MHQATNQTQFTSMPERDLSAPGLDRQNGWTDGRREGEWMDGKVGGCMNEWVDGEMDGCVNGGME